MIAGRAGKAPIAKAAHHVGPGPPEAAFRRLMDLLTTNIMKIIIAPDSFKESLSAARAAEALAEGALAAVPDARIDVCPMADGGEGTVEAMVAATAGEIRTADVYGPLGKPLRVRFGLLGEGGGAGLPGELGFSAARGLAAGEGHAAAGPDGLTAVIEMAAASGVQLVPLELRDPLRATTFGTGQLIMAALDAGAREIIVGIGGSATVDGGCGAAQALGVTFTAGPGEVVVCGVGGGAIGDIVGIDASGRDPRIETTRIRVACDVRNPLTGAEGAARIYGPQKGATPEQAQLLDANLAHLAELIRRDCELDVEQLPGAGAAGGLGAGLVAFAGAVLEPGVDIVAEAVRLSARLHGADLCITGEGSFDAQSRAGKTAVGVAGRAREMGVPVICIPGQASPDAPHEMFAAVRPLVGGEVTLEQAFEQPEIYLKRRAKEALKKFQ
jgi:glycerate kinase